MARTCLFIAPAKIRRKWPASSGRRRPEEHEVAELVHAQVGPRENRDPAVAREGQRGEGDDRRRGDQPLQRGAPETVGSRGAPAPPPAAGATRPRAARRPRRRGRAGPRRKGRAARSRKGRAARVVLCRCRRWCPCGVHRRAPPQTFRLGSTRSNAGLFAGKPRVVRTVPSPSTICAL